MTADPKSSRTVSSTSVLICVCAALVALACLYYGKEARKWTWQQTAAVRYRGDIQNAFVWGQYSSIVGLRYTYDRVLARHDGDYSHNFQLDYPPLRLAVANVWAHLLQKIKPGIRVWRNEYVLTFPLLYFNYLMQLATAVIMFLLVRLWYRRHHGPAGPGGREWLSAATGAGLCAALLFLFNPAVILNSHGWPQWDSWLLAFFSGAVLMSSIDRWGAAGACIGIGCLLKGQILIAAPVLPLLALFQGNRRGALVFVLAWLATALLLVLPWMIRDHRALLYIFGVTVAAVAVCGRYVRSGTLSPRSLWPVGMVAFSAAAVSSAFFFESSMTWLHIGFGYGMRRNADDLVIGPVPNLPELLHYLWNIRLGSGVQLPFDGYLSFRLMLILLYLAALIYSAYRAAKLKTGGSSYFLLAVFAPWLLMFTVMPHMHERYLIYIAGLSATWIFLGVLPAIIHVLLVALSFGAMLHMMLLTNPDAAPGLLQWFNSIYPHNAWLVVGLAAVVVYLLANGGKTAAATVRDDGRAQAGIMENR